MAAITTSWKKIKEVYVGNDGYHDVYWRMYARISAQSGGATTVNVQGRLYLTGNAGSMTSGATTTCGGVVGNYSAWGVNAQGTYPVGETTLWNGSDTTYGNSIGAGVRFYSSPWGWTGDNLYLDDTLTFSANTPPSGLSVSVAELYPTGAKFSVTLSSYGTPATANGRYIEAAILGQNSYGASYRHASDTNSTSSDITVNNTSSGGLTIAPNTQYYYGGKADNTALNITDVTGTFVTLAGYPTVTLLSKSSNEIRWKYTIPADGGKYAKDIYVKYDSSNFAFMTTIQAGITNEYENTVVWAGIDPSVSHTIIVRTTTTAGNSDSEALVIDADQVQLYGSVNGKTRGIKKLYGSVNGKTKKITKLYGSVNGKTKLIYTDQGY